MTEYRIPPRVEHYDIDSEHDNITFTSSFYRPLPRSSQRIQGYLAKNIRSSNDAIDLHAGLIFMQSTAYQNGISNHLRVLLMDALYV